jgi:FkbM family methyltransferase
LVRVTRIVVPAIPIDKIAHSLRTIKLIKLDIEGAELPALEGMVGLLQRDKPYVIFELTDQYLRPV